MWVGSSLSEEASRGQLRHSVRCLSAATGKLKSASPLLKRTCGMEAAGIEPASCEPWVEASTCVVCRFRSRQRRHGKQSRAPTRLRHVSPRAWQPMTRGQSEFVTGCRTPQTGIPKPGMRISTQPLRTAFQWQLVCDQLLTWPADQPRHAIPTCGEPVKSDRPLGVCCPSVACPGIGSPNDLAVELPSSVTKPRSQLLTEQRGRPLMFVIGLRDDFLYSCCLRGCGQWAI